MKKKESLSLAVFLLSSSRSLRVSNVSKLQSSKSMVAPACSSIKWMRFYYVRLLCCTPPSAYHNVDYMSTINRVLVAMKLYKSHPVHLVFFTLRAFPPEPRGLRAVQQGGSAGVGWGGTQWFATSRGLLLTSQPLRGC